MICFICLEEKVPGIPSHGSCAHCNGFVCSEPSQGPRAHAEFCACGCGQLVCEKHYRNHSTGNYGCTPEDCFPRSGSGTAATALFSALMLRSMRDPSLSPLESPKIAAPGEPAGVNREAMTFSINRFINVFTPGHRVLRELASELPNDLWQVHRGQEKAEEWYVDFALPFLLQPAMTAAVSRLAGNALTVSASKLGDPGQELLDRVLVGSGMGVRMGDLARWSRGEPVAEDFRAGWASLFEAPAPADYTIQVESFKASASAAVEEQTEWVAREGFLEG